MLTTLFPLERPTIDRILLQEILSSLPALLVCKTNILADDACFLADNCKIAIEDQLIWVYIDTSLLIEEQDKQFRFGFDIITGVLKKIQQMMKVRIKSNIESKWFYI